MHRENRTPDVNYAPQISSRLPEQTGRLVSSKPVIFVRLGRLEGPKRVWLRIIPSPERCLACPLLFRFAQRSIFQWKWNEDYRVRFNKTFHFVHRCQFSTAILYTGGKILERFLRSARFNRVKSMNFFPRWNFDTIHQLSLFSFSESKEFFPLKFENLKLKCCKLTSQFVKYTSRLI